MNEGGNKTLKKDIKELRRSLADLTVVVNDLAWAMKAAHSEDRNSQRALAGGWRWGEST